MEVVATRHKYHIVRSLPGCTVRQEGANGTVIETTVPADEDTPVFAHSGRWAVEGDENVTVTEVFKLAPQQKLALLGVLGGERLPAGFVRLGYLETTGGQYTRAAIVPRDNIGCRASFRVSQHINYPIICAHESSNYAYYLFAAANVDPGYSYIRWGTAGGVNTRAWYNVGEDSVQELNWLNSKVVKGNDTQIYSLDADTSFTISQDLYLFASNSNGTANSVKSGARLYSVEFSEYSTIIRHFVPALDPTGAPCFIETLSGVPFYNLGTGAFIAGVETQAQLNNVLRKLPDRTGQEVGTLQVRLADDLQTPENEAKLDAMRAKNWEITQAV